MTLRSKRRTAWRERTTTSKKTERKTRSSLFEFVSRVDSLAADSFSTSTEEAANEEEEELASRSSACGGGRGGGEGGGGGGETGGEGGNGEAGWTELEAIGEETAADEMEEFEEETAGSGQVSENASGESESSSGLYICKN